MPRKFSCIVADLKCTMRAWFVKNKPDRCLAYCPFYKLEGEK